MNDILTIKKGMELELKINSLAYGGMGLAKKDNFVIFVKNAIPGQTVNALIYKKKKGYAEARVISIINDSPNAVDVKCSHYWICSKVQNLSYKEQLKEKEKQIEEAFHRIGGFLDFKLSDIKGADLIYNYRIKWNSLFLLTAGC